MRQLDQEKLQDICNPGNNIRSTCRAVIKQESHFSKIATVYRDLRTTDMEPIFLIINILQEFSSFKGADVGCGCGRYVEELFRFLGDKLYLTCVDENENMLRQLEMNLVEKNIQKFETVRAPANNLQLGSNSLDFIVTFNAVHHFDLVGFLNESARTLKDNGYLFVYTRLRSQNKRNIWGRFFPKFHEKETRLHDLEEFKIVLDQIKPLTLSSVRYFKYRRIASMEWVLGRAIQHHYSTFDLYDSEEFEESLKEFQNNIAENFVDGNNVFWNDENIMFIIKRNSR